MEEWTQTPADARSEEWPPATEQATRQEPAQLADTWQLPRREPEQSPPAVDEPVLVEASEKVPLLKREISFGRKRTKTGGLQTEQTVPLLKREISFRRKRTATAGQPFLKRELHIGGTRGSSRSAAAKSAKSKGNAKRLVGLTIGSFQLGAAEIVNNGHAEVVKLASRPLDRGIVVGGELREPAALTAALKAFFRENRLPQKAVRLGIASNRIGMRIIEVEGVESGSQLDNVIRFRAQEALPIPVDQAVLDYHILSEQDVNGAHVRRILLVVAYREPIARYVEACREAGLKVVGVDLEAFALLRALRPLGGTMAAPEAADVVVALGHERSVLAISAHGVCELARVLDWGGFAIDVGLARELDVTPSAAEPTRRAIGARATHVPGGLEPEKAAAARATIQRQIQALVAELVGALQFYQDQPNSLGIREIVLAGGLAQMDGIDREIERLSGVPVRIGDPLEHMTHRKRLGERDDLPALAGAIGLGIEV